MIYKIKVLDTELVVDLTKLVAVTNPQHYGSEGYGFNLYFHRRCHQYIVSYHSSVEVSREEIESLVHEEYAHLIRNWERSNKQGL